MDVRVPRPLAALITDHDHTHPAAPADGPERVASILDHVLAVAADITAHAGAHHAWAIGGGVGPEPASPYRCPVAALDARAHRRPDPYLLARAARVLTYLPALTAPAHDTPGRTTAGLIRELRDARAHDDLTDLPDDVDVDVP